MEPANNFSSVYSTSIEKGVKFFKKNPPVTFWGCKAIFEATHPNSTDHDFIEFYKNVLAQGQFYQELISHYYSYGCFKEAKVLSDRINATCISQLCTLESGFFEPIDALELPPKPDCELGDVANWVKYHFFRRTLNKALKSFTHKSKDAYALIFIYQGNYVKALEYLSGDLFVQNEHILFKALCYFGLGQDIEGIKHYNEALEKGAVITQVFEPFFLLYRFSCALTPRIIDRLHKGLNIPSLELCFFSSDDSPVINRSKKYINLLAKEYPNPFIRFFNLIISAKKTKKISARVFLAAIKAEPFQKIDYLTIVYLSSYDRKEAVEYCKERDKAHPHPFLLEHLIISLESLIAIEESNDLAELKKQTEIYRSRGYDPENIRFAEARIAKSEGALDKAKALYLESIETLCFDSALMSLADTYILLDDPKSACDLLIEKTRIYKYPELLDYAEKVLIRHAADELLKEFYKTHRKDSTKFELEYKALEEKTFEKYKDRDENELLALPIDQAIEIFQLKIDRNRAGHSSYLYLSFLFFKKGAKDEALKSIKKISVDDFLKIHDTLFKMIKTDLSFICFIIPYLPKNNPLADRIAMVAYFFNEEYLKVLEPSLAFMKEYPDNPEPLFFRTQSFYRLGNVSGTLYMIELIEEKGWMNEKIFEIKRELEQKKNIEEKKASEASEPRTKKEAARKNPQNPFVPEKPEISDAKLSHLKSKEALRNKGETCASHIGSRSFKNGVDPIERKKRFNPLEFKPKEDVPVKTPSIPLPSTHAPQPAILPLFLTKLNPDQRAQVLYAIERLNELASLQKIECDPCYKNQLLLRNYLYGYVRIFGILSELSNPPIKDKLYTLRNEARHEFMVCSLEGCTRIFNYFSQIDLVSQMKEWASGGVVTNLVISPYSLRDPLENRKFEQSSPLEKNTLRVQFMKNELELLTHFMEPIKTFEDFKNEGIYQNAMKASMMMIGKTWTKLEPDLKARLAPHFRTLNLEGNKGAHHLKPKTMHHDILFHMGFEDIPIESLWDFAKNANALKNFLVGII